MVAGPLTGFPDAATPLQTTKVESQTPPQTRPPGEMVATLVLDELKVIGVVTARFEEVTADAASDSTSPATREAVGGEIRTWATISPLFEDDPPPQPAARPAKREMMATLTTGHESKVPEQVSPGRFRITPIDVNIEEIY